MTAACPSDEILGAWATARVDPTGGLLAHVDDCAACREVLAALSAWAPPRAPDRLGRYQLEAPLGDGAMGMVWAAWDPQLQRRVAIKLLKHGADDPRRRARLVAEARALARVQHPHVVAVYDVGEADDDVFIATELIEGVSIDRWARGRGWAEVVAACAQAARGLGAAHRAGLIHRDVKPANLMVGTDGRVRVTDFGLAVTGDAALAPGAATIDRPAQVSHRGGTPAYMAPEQRAAHVIDARVDQFAMALTLVEGLVGRRVAAGTRVDELAAHRPEVPRPVWQALATALAVAPAARHGSIDDFAQALELARPRSLGGHGALAPEVSSSPRHGRNRVLVGLLIGLTVAVGTGAVGAALMTREPGSPSPSSVASIGTPPAPALATAARAATIGDGQACLVALAAHANESTPADAQVAHLRATCEMQVGRCAEGQARLRGLGTAAAAIDALALLWCPADQGTTAERVARLSKQIIGGRLNPRSCASYAQLLTATLARADLTGPELESLRLPSEQVGRCRASAACADFHAFARAVAPRLMLEVPAACR